VILCAQPVAADSANDAELSSLLKKQTEEFSQAGQKGDVAVFDRYLDPEVVFTNETGSIATKKDPFFGEKRGMGKRELVG
jgi:hypothetical protein